MLIISLSQFLDSFNALTKHNKQGSNYRRIYVEWMSSIVVRALIYCAKNPQFQAHFKLRVGRSLTATQQRMGTWWKHWGDVGGEERNWPT